MTSLRSWLLITQLVSLAGCSAARTTDTHAGAADAGPLEPCTEPGTYDVYLVTMESDCGNVGPIDPAIPLEIPPPTHDSSACEVTERAEVGECGWRWSSRCTGDPGPMPPSELTLELEARGGRVEGSYVSRRTTETGAVCTSRGTFSTRPE